MDLELGAEDVEALASCTEGWIAGLQMAAVSMQGREDLRGFVQTFTGSNRYILDYLVEEVLQRQSEEVQAFLLQTAVLERMSGSLCDAVVGVEERNGGADHLQAGGFSLSPGRVISPGQEMLKYLERANLFIVPLDSRREWYRYHRLFTDLLRKRLQEVAPDLIPGLHRRASLWYEQHGDAAEAIHHALAAEDFERAAVLIERATEATLMRSEVTTFLGWIEALPPALVRARTELSIWYTWVLLLNGCPLKTIEARLQEEENAPDFSPAKALPLRLFITLFQGDLAQATELSRQALEQLPEDALFLRELIAWFSGAAESVYGDSEACQRSLEETARKGQETGNLLVVVGAVSHRAEVQMRIGRLHEAEATYQRALASAKDPQGRTLPIASEPLLGLGHLAWEWGDLETAERYLREGIALARQWLPLSALEGYLILAYVKQAQGDSDSACTVLQEAQELAARFDVTELDDFIVAVYQAKQWIAQGDLESAVRWARQRGLLEEDRVVALGEQADPASEYMRRHEHLTLARLLLALGRPGDVLSLLEPLVAPLERDEQIVTCIEAHILIALALAASGSPAQALAAMKHALSCAEPGGYIRPFVDEGMVIVPLLRQAAAQGIAVDYVARLLEALEVRLKTAVALVPAPLEHPRRPLGKAGHILVFEPVSEREIEVVRALAEGLSNQEIAEMLFITVGTVKKHLKNIYGKLGVHSRTHAVAHARESGLL
jgi:LuxR family maltose regulon positive regulatory protein